MCLSLPGKIVSIDSSGELLMGDVDFSGVRRDICLEWVPEAKIGDYVLAHVGTALTLLDEETAKTNIETLNEISSKLNNELN